MTVAKSKKRATKAGTSKESAALRRALFLEALLNDESIGQAAITAGFSPKSAASQGCRLSKDVNFQQELAKRRAALLDKFQLTTERTLREVARLAYSDPRKFYNTDGTLKAIHELDDDCAATIASVEVDEIKEDGRVVGLTRKLKQWDKNSALEKAMKHLGLYEKDNKQAKEKVKVIFMTGGKDPELE